MYTNPSSGDDGLQFDRAEPLAAGAVSGATCAVCHQPIASTYYAIGSALFCEDCRENVIATIQGGSRVARFFKALFFGIVVAIVCSAAWLLIVKLTGYAIGIVAIFVGAAIGVAVRKGASHRGGWVYQFMAMILTYLSITVSYVPDLITAMTQETTDSHSQLIQSDAERLRIAIDREGAIRMNGNEASVEDVTKELERLKSANGFVMYYREGRRETSPPHVADVIGEKWEELEIPVVYCIDAECQTADTESYSFSNAPLLAKFILILFAFIFAILVPFLSLPENIIGLLIIGIALWEAWKLNKRLKIEISGPHLLSERGMHATAANATSPATNYGPRGSAPDNTNP